MLQLLCPVLALPGIVSCSESPRWLFITGQGEKARQILINIHANGDISSPGTQAEILDIETTLSQEQESPVTAGYRGLISTPGNRRRLLITVTLGIFSQWVGNGVVTYYLSMVLNTIGISSVKEQTLISGCLQIWNIILAVIGANLVDRLGRRVLFLLSFALMFTSYIIITACSGSFANSGTKVVGITVIPFLFLFYAGYDIAM
jgi:Sugar (and other) transporter.